MSGTQTLTNSLVAFNQPGNCNISGGTLADGGNNLSFPDATCPGTNGDPLLGALADNGGPTQTRALGLGSPALYRAYLLSHPQEWDALADAIVVNESRFFREASLFEALGEHILPQLVRRLSC